MHLFDKILIANRGEIAVRIIQTAKKLSIKTVAIYSPADTDSLAVQLADEAFPLHSNELSESYLNIEKIIAIAKMSKSQAIHPGYGFLSENPKFVQSCNDAQITFIGPEPDVMQLMGNKIDSRKFVEQLGVPMTKAFTGDTKDLIQQIPNMDFPVLIKAAAGGGGKGMRIIHDPNALEEAIISTSREAGNYFNDPTVYVEKYIENPRHIEMQILGDHHGNVIHLFERECSIQRRYQKIIEEAPSTSISDTLRAEIAKAAIDIAKKTNYTNAGTIEFIVENETKFYFLEMNTRVQVEHPVTEMITGVDIVEKQIKIAAGFPLDIRQDELKVNGHSIECRIYAEDGENNFMPSPGMITQYIKPEGTGIRVDSGISKAGMIYPFYDPMISKLIVHGTDRNHAIQKMINSLNNYCIQGIKTNTSYLLSILHDTLYLENQIWTKYCESRIEENLKILSNLKKEIKEYDLLSAALAYDLLIKEKSNRNVWNTIGYWREWMDIKLQLDEINYSVKVANLEQEKMEIMINEESFHISIHSTTNENFKIFINDKHFSFYVLEESNNILQIYHNGFIHQIKRLDKISTENIFKAGASLALNPNELKSQMPGKVVKLNVKPGDTVSKGDQLIIVESMKMENSLSAQMDGIIDEINVQAGDNVDNTTVLISIK